MNYTTNFNLNKPEGTDLYNHLTVDNPNMDTIDAAMQANKLASIGAATELVSGTVHAITRSDSNQNIFKFKATGDFKAGDTITVDGVSVNAYTTGGQQLLDDAYVLSAEVVCVLDNTSLWVLTNKVPNADEVQYDSLLTVKHKIDDMSNRLAGLGKATLLSYDSLPMTFTIPLGFTPDNDHFGQILVYNAHQGVSGIIALEPNNLVYRNVLGSLNPSFSLSGSDLICDFGTRLWSTTTFIIDRP